MINFYEESKIESINNAIISGSFINDQNIYEHDMFSDIKDKESEELDFYSLLGYRLA